ncbi:uncharacterized protein LOC142235488 [Haematobia irritans]|uniref:uncharacterized protein LOC142235488 n=1 Tax=Haematobia irritans TaxID=7368 RepID=UPI003F4F5CDD
MTEKMICHRIEHYLESEMKISNSQFGFRRGRSTQDNVITLWSAAQCARKEGKYTTCLFLDIKSAFENVNIEQLILKYRALGVGGHTCDVLYNMLRFKDLLIERDGKSYYRRSFTGTPQGSVISPLSFNIYINDLFYDLDVEILGYADDVSIFYSDISLDRSIEKIQNAINILERRLDDIQLSLSANKSKAMIITTAEAQAIIESLKFIKASDLDRYIIISDSKSVLMALSSFGNNRTHPYIWIIRELLYELDLEGYTVHFLWVPSHTGIPGNEHADYLAVNHTDTLHYPAIPYMDIKSYDKNKSLRSWQQKWNESPFGRRLYSLSRTVNTTPWFRNRKLPREVITLICRVRFGHTCAKAHLFRVNMTDSSACECGSTQTIDHLTFECPSMSLTSRDFLIRKLRNAGIRQLNCIEILKKDDQNSYVALHKLFKCSDKILKGGIIDLVSQPPFTTIHMC